MAKPSRRRAKFDALGLRECDLVAALAEVDPAFDQPRVNRLRNGSADLLVSTAMKVADAASKILGRRVTVEELFGEKNR